MNCTLEVLKNDENEYIICAIKFGERLMTYFDGQTTPHQTHRWMSMENWAAFDKRIRKLFFKKKLNNLKKTLNYNLGNGVHLELNNLTASKSGICELLSKDLFPENVISVIECKISWKNEYTNGYELSPPDELELRQYDPIDTNSNDLASISDTSLPISQDDDVFLITESDNSPISCKQQKNENKHKTNKSSKVLKTTSTEDILEQPSTSSKCFRKEEKKKIKSDNFLHVNNSNLQNDVSIKNTTSPLLNEISSDSSDIFRPSISKFDNNDNHEEIVVASSDTSDILESHPKKSEYETPKKKNNTIKKTSLNDENCSPSFPKQTSPLTNSNENNTENSDNLELFTQPPEKRRRKLYYEHNNAVQNRGESKDKNTKPQSTIEENLESCLKVTRSNAKDCKTPVSNSTRLTHKNSTAKKKKSSRDIFQKSCDQEKQTMNKWLTKKGSKNDNQSKKSNKDKTKPTTSSKYQSAFSSLDSNSVEHILSHEEFEEHLTQKEAKVKAERKIIENLKELLPEEPKKVKMLDLLKVPWQDVLATFEEHHLEFENLFRTHKSQTKFRGIDGVDHFLVINLLSNPMEQKMMGKLGELFEKNNDYGPRYGELFSMVLMPEWILRIFMKKFKMSRNEAINHIKAQNAYKEFHTVPDDELHKMIKIK